jgi:hypothetical protein
MLNGLRPHPLVYRPLQLMKDSGECLLAAGVWASIGVFVVETVRQCRTYGSKEVLGNFWSQTLHAATDPLKHQFYSLRLNKVYRACEQAKEENPVYKTYAAQRKQTLARYDTQAIALLDSFEQKGRLKAGTKATYAAYMAHPRLKALESLPPREVIRQVEGEPALAIPSSEQQRRSHAYPDLKSAFEGQGIFLPPNSIQQLLVSEEQRKTSDLMTVRQRYLTSLLHSASAVTKL